MSVANSEPVPSPRLDLASLVVAAAFALLTWVALGVDLPDSRRRFVRLASSNF